MVIKLLFLNNIENVSFNSSTKMDISHLELFEYWFALNGMVCLTYLGKMGLTWHSPYKYLNTTMGDCAALEAAGVQGKVKWQLVRDKGWQKEDSVILMKHMVNQKQRGKKDEEEPPKPKEPFSAYER